MEVPYHPRPEVHRVFNRCPTVRFVGSLVSRTSGDWRAHSTAWCPSPSKCGSQPPKSRTPDSPHPEEPVLEHAFDAAIESLILGHVSGHYRLRHERYLWTVGTSTSRAVLFEADGWNANSSKAMIPASKEASLRDWRQPAKLAQDRIRGKLTRKGDTILSARPLFA
jgi:hypothetical protein